jgi:hypothetical protein
MPFDPIDLIKNIPLGHCEARHAWYLELIAKADELRTSYRWRMPELYD